jgi:hypothetical protein
MSDKLLDDFIEFSESRGYGYQVRFAVNDFKASKSKQVIFTTNKKIPIYHGDRYYYADDDFNMRTEIAYNHNTIPNREIFYTPDEAQEYILMNKPCLSVNEAVYGIDEAWVTTRIMNKLKQLAQEKINSK